MDKETQSIDETEVIIDHPAPNNEHFTINSIKAAEILGINRTRLSQLTSKGLFPYERRKIDSRSRLFYRLNDLLNYQRKSSFGNLEAMHVTKSLETKALVPLLPPGTSDLAIALPLLPTQKKRLAMHTPQKHAIQKRILKTALEVKAETLKQNQLTSLTAKINILENKLATVLNILTESQNTFIDQKARNQLSKEAMLRRPGPKRMFKIIKRSNFKK